MGFLNGRVLVHGGLDECIFFVWGHLRQKVTTLLHELKWVLEHIFGCGVGNVVCACHQLASN